jgi:hypothetical protein
MAIELSQDGQDPPRRSRPRLQPADPGNPLFKHRVLLGVNKTSIPKNATLVLTVSSLRDTCYRNVSGGDTLPSKVRSQGRKDFLGQRRFLAASGKNDPFYLQHGAEAFRRDIAAISFARVSSAKCPSRRNGRSHGDDRRLLRTPSMMRYHEVWSDSLLFGAWTSLTFAAVAIDWRLDP